MAEDRSSDFYSFLAVESTRYPPARNEFKGLVSQRPLPPPPPMRAYVVSTTTQVTAEVVANLRNFFAPHNAALEELLGVRLPSSWQMKR